MGGRLAGAQLYVERVDVARPQPAQRSGAERRDEVPIEYALVSLAVFGENSGPAFANHSSSSDPTVARLADNGPSAAWVTIAASARCASRFPPLTVFVA